MVPYSLTNNDGKYLTGIGNSDQWFAFVRERRRDLVQVELRLAATDLRIVPDVAECAADRLRGHRIRIRGDRLALSEVERSNVVEPHQMIGVRVREEDEVEPRDRVAKKLQSQIGRRIDQEMLA